MAGFKVDFFKGLRPRISATKLRPGEAETALNVKLGSGDLEPIPDKSTEQACVGTDTRTIYLYHDNTGDLWFEWTDRVQVAQGPIKNDEYNRVYYTGDATGNGKPKVTTTTLSRAGSGKYPQDWLYMGVPAPATACTTTVVQLPEDKPASERLVEDMKTDEFEIDQVLVTVAGVGTDSNVWRLNSGALGSIAFDVLPGTAFRVTEVINTNRVKLESATEPGITMRTANSDKTTVNDWHPMDNQGSTKEADFLGWRIPPDMDVKIAQHKLAVGDVIVVSAINYNPQWFGHLTQDLYGQSWPAYSTYNDSGVTYSEVRDARISNSSVSGDTPFTLSGSFYYDVDRASSTASELEDRSYVYTYVNSFGEEGPPSPPSEVTPQLDGRDVIIQNLALPPTIGYDITKMRLYRTNSTEAGTEYQFVKEFNLSRITTDDVLSEDLGETIATTTWDGPPDDMGGIVDMPNGMMVGFSGRTVHFCEPYFPHAWPPEYDQAIAYDIVALEAFGTSVAVLTTGWPYIITGSHPRNANVRPIKVNYACVSAESVATDGDNVYYASADGLVELNGVGARLVTEQFTDKSDWEVYEPTTLVGEFYEGRYYGFYDFSGATPDPVVTAEISGTVTSAEEANIIDGGLTLIITVYNDTLVAAGTAFNNQRTNIISELTASTSQTLGWNNLVRDGSLAVGDVVRTDDNTITITLPDTAGYAISSAEVVSVTVPNEVLVTSNTDVPAGSTFTIQPDAHETTVTLSGTIDGDAESDIVSGGSTLIITLTNDTWQTTLTDAMKQGIIDGLYATTNELGGWNDTVPQEIATTDVARTSDTVVTITMPAVADYSITENETIYADVPHEALTTLTDVDATSSNSVGIVATGVTSALFSGTAVSGGVTENEIIAGSETLIITLTNDTWIAAGTGPIGTTAQSDALIDAIIAQASPTNGWNNQVLATLSQAHLVRTSDTVATITLPAIAGYSIATNETVGCDIPNAVLTTSTEDLTVSNTFGITAQSPVTAVVSGTVVSTAADEIDVVAGGLTIVITLSDDTWKAAGTGPIGSTADTQAIINGIDSAQAEANGWDAVVKAGLTPATDVVRTSDTVCTITLPAFASYNITADETITVTVPAAALNISASAVVASPTFDIAYDAPASAAITGTATSGIVQDDVRDGGKTIIITLTDDTWVASGTAFNAIRQDIIDGLDAASSPTNGWNNEVRDGTLAVTDVVRTSDTVVTITLPATPNYSVTANETITVTVPASALDQSAIPVTASPTITVTAINSVNIVVLDPLSSTSGPWACVSDSSFTDWTETEVDPDTSGSGRYYTNIACAGDTKTWIMTSQLDTSYYYPEVFRSTNDGSSWSKVWTDSSPYTINNGYPHGICYNETEGLWVILCDGNASGNAFCLYSTDDGVNWTECGEDSALTPVGYLYNNNLHYGGTQRMVTGIYNESNGSGGYNYCYVRSANLNTGTPDDPWTKQTLVFNGTTTASRFGGGVGSGNGKNLFLVCNSDGDFLSSVPHNGTTETYIGDFATTSLGAGRVFIVLGTDKWLMMRENGYALTCPVGDEGTIGNWSDHGDVLSIGSFDVWHCYYDGGTTGSNGLGFVALVDYFTTNGRIYTSPDGVNWTLSETLTQSNTLKTGASKYPLSLA